MVIAARENGASALAAIGAGIKGTCIIFFGGYAICAVIGIIAHFVMG
jgi:hypothetical protein